MVRTVHSSRCINTATALLLVACAAGLVQCSKNGPAGRQYDRNVDFATYRTFAFVNRGYRPPAWLDAAVEDSITTRLESRGFKHEESTDADLVLSYQVSRQQRRVWHSSFNSRGVPTFRPETFQREALLILTLSMLDPTTDKVVWTSYAALPPTNDWQKVRSNIDRVVTRILKKFPP